MHVNEKFLGLEIWLWLNVALEFEAGWKQIDKKWHHNVMTPRNFLNFFVKLPELFSKIDFVFLDLHIVKESEINLI